MPRTTDQKISDLREMILSDTGHLNRYVAHGDTVLAHQMVDAIIDSVRALEDLTGERAPYVAPPAAPAAVQR